jgi:oligopeptide/dipeptide ABC transporter ATP-binding protein
VPRHGPNGAGAQRQRIVLGGDVPSPVNPPSACVFHPRCPRFQRGHCDVELPLLRRFEPGHEAACHYPVERWPMTEEELRRPFGATAGDPNETND